MKIKLISLMLIFAFLFCGCSHFELPDTSQYEPFTTPQDEKEVSLSFDDLPENFYTEYEYFGVKFTVNRHGNEILKENEFGNFVYYEKNGDNWECRYFENDMWQDISYVENEAATIKKVLYFIATENKALTDGEKTGKTENVCGFSAEEYFYSDNEGTVSCFYSEENKMTVKETDTNGNENEILLWKAEKVDFSVALP